MASCCLVAPDLVAGDCPAAMQIVLTSACTSQCSIVHPACSQGLLVATIIVLGPDCGNAAPCATAPITMELRRGPVAGFWAPKGLFRMGSQAELGLDIGQGFVPDRDHLSDG